MFLTCEFAFTDHHLACFFFAFRLYLCLHRRLIEDKGLSSLAGLHQRFFRCRGAFVRVGDGAAAGAAWLFRVGVRPGEIE